jgi:preprotein translocase subunit SecF
LSLTLVILSFLSFFYSGLNFGIDFNGGTLIEIETEDNVGIAEVRKTLGELSLGDIQIQEFGSKNDILIRVEEQLGGDEAQQNVVGVVKDQLNNNLKSNVTYRRTEVVGPKVSSELIQAGGMAIIAAVFAMLFLYLV